MTFCLKWDSLTSREVLSGSRKEKVCIKYLNSYTKRCILSFDVYGNLSNLIISSDKESWNIQIDMREILKLFWKMLELMCTDTETDGRIYVGS